MVTGLLNNAGWHVNHKRVERIWRREGLKVPQKQKKKGWLWLNDGSCVRLRPERPNHIWSYDFVQDRTADGRVYRTLNIIDEDTREALMICVDRKLNSTDVLDALTDLFILRGPPEYIRSDKGPEFIAQKVPDWIAAVGAKTAYTEPGSPLSGHRHAMPCRAVHGKTDTANVSTHGYAPLGSMLSMPMDCAASRPKVIASRARKWRKMIADPISVIGTAR